MGTLCIDGRVREARDLSFEDLASLPGQIDDVGTLAPGRRGGAVSLDAILAAVGVDPHATSVTLESTDGSFSQEAPLSALREAIVVYRLGKQPLPAEEGGPVRFLIPNLEECLSEGVDRCTNVKRLGRIRVG